MPGVAAPKGSRTAGVRKNGSIYTRPASKREKGWIGAVRARAREVGETLPAPYRVEIDFLMPRPQRPAHPHPTRGDIDKLVRSTLDGLTQGELITDDSHVVEIVARKAWCDPGDEHALIVVSPA